MRARNRTEEIKQFLLDQVDRESAEVARIAAEHFGITRQAVKRHLKEMVEDGILQASGNTRARRYKVRTVVVNEFNILLEEGLQEDLVWRKWLADGLSWLPRNVMDICHYGFTEMMNNVIDHSKGRSVGIRATRTGARVEIVLADDGIGIFNKIRDELKLEDEYHAILELSKGKLTTDPKRHTGEGIFFTSRVFDLFSILSGNLFFFHDHEDWLLEHNMESTKGTVIAMKIDSASTRSLKGTFDEYTSEEDFGFNKTHVPVFLARYGEENLVSRSQAKRLLARFEKFKEIILDFKDVETIGQAFADEIFRVFRNEHPGINITWGRASDEIQAMIRRVSG